MFAFFPERTSNLCYCFFFFLKGISTFVGAVFREEFFSFLSGRGFIGLLVIFFAWGFSGDFFFSEEVEFEKIVLRMEKRFALSLFSGCFSSLIVICF